MVKPEVIRRRLQNLDEYLSYLDKVKSYPEDKFHDNIEIWASTERFLQMSIECINDLASHIISEENLGTIDQYRDIPQIFYRENFIDEDLKQKWIRMIGFRNILVHAYAEVNRSEVYKIIQHNLVDIKALKKVFGQFL